MAVAVVPDVPVARVRRRPHSRQNVTFAAAAVGEPGRGQAEARWQRWFTERFGQPETYPAIVDRPQTRADCVGGQRPCPFVSCEHSLYLDAHPVTGALTINHADVLPWGMDESCVLDIADRGGLTLEEVGRLRGLTRERVRQLEERGVKLIKDHSERELGLPPARGEGFTVAGPMRGRGHGPG